jgi:CBS domain-containing protein
MYLYNFLQNLPSLASIVESVASPLANLDILTVDPDMPLLAAIAMMSQRSSEIAAPHSAMLVVANELLVGIVTDRDLVKLTATQADLQGLKVADVMTAQPHTLVSAGEQTVLSAVSILQHYRKAAVKPRTLRSGISGEQVDDSSRATEYRVFGV